MDPRQLSKNGKLLQLLPAAQLKNICRLITHLHFYYSLNKLKCRVQYANMQKCNMSQLYSTMPSSLCKCKNHYRKFLLLINTNTRTFHRWLQVKAICKLCTLTLLCHVTWNQVNRYFKNKTFTHQNKTQTKKMQNKTFLSINYSKIVNYF